MHSLEKALKTSLSNYVSIYVFQKIFPIEVFCSWELRRRKPFTFFSIKLESSPAFLWYKSWVLEAKACRSSLVILRFGLFFFVFFSSHFADVVTFPKTFSLLLYFKTSLNLRYNFFAAVATRINWFLRRAKIFKKVSP